MKWKVRLLTGNYKREGQNNDIIRKLFGEKKVKK